MLWFVSIPILDCIALIFSRIRKRISISSPGRDHIHHKLMIKFSSEQTLAIILLVSILTGLVGVYLDNNYASWVSTSSFLLFASIYFAFNNYYSHLYSKIKKYV
jgi:UDP-GlcNAc:undecaprenyl-phosphate GlcNAc-1-phosphate transferase